MSFHRAQAPTPSSSFTTLTARLLSEFAEPSAEPTQQPNIIAEPPEPAPISRLVVIWDDWSDLSAQERSHIIMEAYTQHVGLHEAAKVSVAMGLTSAEAAKLRLS